MVFEEPTRSEEPASQAGTWVLIGIGAAFVLLGLVIDDLLAFIVGGACLVVAIVRAVLGR